jgi:hypothetical protein
MKGMRQDRAQSRFTLLTRCAASVALAASGSAAAFQPLITDDTGTQGKGGNQLEAGFARTTDKLEGLRFTADEVPLAYTRGLADALDVYLALAHVRLEADGARERGWGNVALGAKWRFFEDEESKLSLALKPEIQFPVSSDDEARGLGSARTSFGLAVLLTRETGFGAVHANLAVSRIDYDDPVLRAAERRTQYRLSVAPVWDVTEQFKLALDVGVLSNPDAAMRTRMGYAELGAIYSRSKDLDFALGVIQGMSDGPVDSLQWTAGVTWRFQ